MQNLAIVSTRRPDSRRGEPFTPRDDALLVQARREGQQWPDIARVFGRSVSALRMRHEKVVVREESIRLPDGRARPRHCLTCSTIFASAHSGNRMCEFCGEAAERSSPFEPEDVPTMLAPCVRLRASTFAGSAPRPVRRAA